MGAVVGINPRRMTRRVSTFMGAAAVLAAMLAPSAGQADVRNWQLELNFECQVRLDFPVKGTAKLPAKTDCNGWASGMLIDMRVMPHVFHPIGGVGHEPTIGKKGQESGECSPNNLDGYGCFSNFKIYNLHTQDQCQDGVPVTGIGNGHAFVNTDDGWAALVQFSFTRTGTAYAATLSDQLVEHTTYGQGDHPKWSKDKNQAPQNISEGKIVTKGPTGTCEQPAKTDFVVTGQAVTHASGDPA